MKKFSTKYIIFILVLLLLGGIYIILKRDTSRKENEKLIKEEYEEKIKILEEEKKIKEETARKEQEQKRQEQEKAKQIAEKEKAIEEKCNEAQRLFNSRKYKEAVQLTNEILKEDTNNYRAYSIKGISLCFDRKSSGLNDIRKALEIKADYGYAMYNLALAYEISWQYDTALEWYEKAILADSDTTVKALSNYSIAVIYAKKNENAKAGTYLRKAVELNPELTKSAEKDSNLSKIKLD